MKKVLALLLSAVLVFGSGIIAVSADAAKIDESLQGVMTATPDDAKIEVHVWLYCKIDESEVFRQAIKECGYVGGLPLNMTLEEVYAYKAVYNRIVSEQEAAVSNSFVEKLGIAEGDIVYLGKHPYVIANLTKDQIREADTYPEVESLSCIAEMYNTPIYTEPTESIEPATTGHRYENSFKQKYETEDEEVGTYRELYYHKDANGEIDWALAACGLNMFEPMPYTAVIGNRVIRHSNYAVPFESGYAVYDVKADRFISAASSAARAYDGFVKAFDENVTEGKPLGDLDGDNETSIVDATIIQRCEASMRDYPADDEITFEEAWGFTQKYYSDFNRDGDRGILDVTAIQRYLVDLPY